MISYMISYLTHSLRYYDIAKNYDIMYDIIYDIDFLYDIIHDIIKSNYKNHSLRYSCMILPKISYTYQLNLAMISVSYDIIGTYHYITPLISLLISVSSDIIGL